MSNYESIIQKIQDLNDRISEIDEQLEDINIDIDLFKKLIDFIPVLNKGLYDESLLGSLETKVDRLTKKKDVLEKLHMKLVSQRIELSAET